jgi:hypothetical protein
LGCAAICILVAQIAGGMAPEMVAESNAVITAELRWQIVESAFRRRRFRRFLNGLAPRFAL